MEMEHLCTAVKASFLIQQKQMSFKDKLTQLAYQVRTRFMRVPGLRLKLRYGHKNQIQYQTDKILKNPIGH